MIELTKEGEKEEGTGGHISWQLVERREEVAEHFVMVIVGKIGWRYAI